MKLKKIASLMLAGVMAVSMLAGCNTASNGGNNNDDGQNQTTPTNSKVVDYANQTLSSTAKKYMTYESASWLDTALKDVATNKSNFSAENITDVFYDDGIVSYYDNDWANAMADKIVDTMSGKEAYTHNNYEDHGFDMVPADKESKSIVWVYTVSGVLDEEMAVNAVAGSMSEWMAEDHLGQPIDDGNYDCDYTAEISALKVTNSNLTVESAWVIAIAVTQNVTKAANAEV